MSKFRWGCILLVIDLGFSFQLPNLFNLPSPAKTGGSSSAANAILEAVSFTKNGKSASLEKQLEVLQLVRELELQDPAPDNLLVDESAAKQIDGTWYLQYTSPSNPENSNDSAERWKPENAKEGDANIETVQFNAQGTVSAAGIPVDASDRVVKQTIDVTNSRVENDIGLDWGRIFVAGSFRPSSSVPTRAVVAFDTAIITLSNGFEINLGFLFTAISLIRRTKENGWLETTFINENMRIGRGNKGTMFVLTRDVEAVKP